MQNGTVKWFSDSKGFGFIRPLGGGDDVFVHHSSIDMDGFRTLKPGDPVTYESTMGSSSFMATRVNLVPVVQNG
jgi:CspA family cold shock protein